jgi:hypothetical protein
MMYVVYTFAESSLQGTALLSAWVASWLLQLLLCRGGRHECML